MTAPIADYACRLMRYLLVDFGNVVAPEIVSGSVDSKKKKLLKFIDKAGPEGIIQRDLTRSTPELTRKDRNDLLGDLMESGEIAYKESKKTESSKVKTFRYWTAANYLKHIGK